MLSLSQYLEVWQHSAFDCQTEELKETFNIVYIGGAETERVNTWRSLGINIPGPPTTHLHPGEESSETSVFLWETWEGEFQQLLSSSCETPELFLHTQTFRF